MSQTNKTYQEESRAAITALKYINNTDRHVFLTGKAGTGKTTFLKKIVQFTHKNVVVAAPTGIAAINADGVTLHSLFQLPFGSFLPQNNYTFSYQPGFQLTTPKKLLSELKIHSNKRALINQLELLIIDEVSMLRADMLDAIDVTLRHIRRKRHLPFGGLQILFIGDLQQLPPVVKDREWEFLKQFYKSVYFFDALALKDNPPVYVELEKIYRQSDYQFVKILNGLRDNNISNDDIRVLNQAYKPISSKDENKGYVYLTTHNYKADAVNQEKLSAIKKKSFFYDADILYDFPEHIFPIEPSLELKVGAQIMFIKNDPSGERRFFNGKIGFIDELGTDEIIVRFDDDTAPVEVERYTWENKRFVLDKENNEIQEKVIGQFCQYPIKLAWAITVHKSQGLTFEKAIIDVEDAFAPGQVYVALSRLTSLQGLILTAEIPLRGIEQERCLIDYSKNKQPIDQLARQYLSDSRRYLFGFTQEAFNFNSVKNSCDYHYSTYDKDETKSEKQKHKQWAEKVRNDFVQVLDMANKFLKQVNKIQQQPTNETIQFLAERVGKAIEYFEPLLKDYSKDVKEQITKLKGIRGVKAYINELRELENVFFLQLQKIHKASSLLNAALENTDVSRNDLRASKVNQERKESQTKELREENKTTKTKKEKKTKEKKPKIDTYKVTYDLFKQGVKPEEIATMRGFVLSTIENHLARYVKLGEIAPESIVDIEKLQEINKTIQEKKTLSLSDLKNVLGDDYSYSDLRFGVNAFKKDFGDDPFNEK